MTPLNLRIGRGRRWNTGGLRGACLAVVVATSAATAQGPVRTTVENTNTWYSFFGDHRVSGRWSLWYDVHLRREGLPGERWQQLLLRPGVTYDVAQDVRLTAGYGYIVTHQYGEDPIAARFPEHRLWEQLTLNQQAARVAVSHRFRLEQRYLGVMSAPPAGQEPEVERWRFTQRFRYFIRGTLPLGSAKTGPYVTGYNEIFVGLGRDVQLNILEQNRLFGGIGWRLTPTLRVEGGYLQQQIIRASGRRVESNNTLSVTLFSTAPWGH